MRSGFMTHVFIVNDKTLKYHLEYMFAGIGAGCDAPFLEDSEYINPKKKINGVTAASERNLVAMIADISRVRAGDKIIFYLQASNHEGQFFGIFKAVGYPFYDSNENNYLSAEMEKKLNFRIRFEPDEVYSKGVSEHKALDLISDINHPSEMCWSLIYRKLKGNRGCTMITDYESERLIDKIRNEEDTQLLTGKSFTYDTEKNRIVAKESVLEYEGERKALDVKDRLLVKSGRGNAHESHLQAYIVQNIFTEPLKSLLGIDNNTWVGNEVSCGVGMQRIDVVTVQHLDQKIKINIIELKDEKPYESIVTYQLIWYIDWVKNYWVPLFSDMQVEITPIVIAKKVSETVAGRFKEVADTLVYPQIRNLSVKPVGYISFDVINKDLSFEKVF